MPGITSGDYSKFRPIIPLWRPPPATTESIDWADILTVDLSKYDTARQELVGTITTALHRDGFFYVVNHGIDRETLNRQYSLANIALNQVSKSEKEKYRAPIKEEGSFKGYKLQSFWEVDNGVRDRIEHFNMYVNDVATDPSTSYPEVMRLHLSEINAFFSEIRKKVTRRICNLMDLALGLTEGHIWSLHETLGGSRKGNDALRYMVYDPLTSDETTKTNGVMLKGHTDFNTIGCLISQPITALQALMPDGVWRYVQHKENALVINIGDCLSFMSGGYFKATIHRVVRPPKDQERLRRLCVFLFANFLDDVRLDLFPSERVKEEGRVIFEDTIPTALEWRRARVKSYGVTDLVKGEEYDVEVVNGIQVRHYN